MAKGSPKRDGPKVALSVRKHLLPPILGLSVMAVIFILLNLQWLSARYTYNFHEPKPLTVQPISAKVKETTPTLMIPAISVQAPVIFEPSVDDNKVQLALQRGVLHYGTTANPGQIGNVVIFGHSSGLPWSSGDYKYVFTRLDKVRLGDLILLDYQGKRYIYKITAHEVIVPTNLSVLNQHSAKPVLTLITCTPAGSNKYRLVVHADQISPKPTEFTAPAPIVNKRLPSRLPN
jgi:sortase A